MTRTLAEARKREAVGVGAAQEALRVHVRLEEQTKRLETMRRRLMLAAQEGGVWHEELADLLGRSKAWVTAQLAQARQEARERV